MGANWWPPRRVDVLTYLEDFGRAGWAVITTFPELAYYHSVLGSRRRHADASWHC